MKKNILKAEELAKKYGLAKIMVVPKDFVATYIKRGITPLTKAMNFTSTKFYMFKAMLQQEMIPMLRCEAECDPNYKQPIPYVVLRDKEDRIFLTTRKAGDERLVGMSSIGTGGHVEEGESIYDAMYRELREEVGLDEDNIFTYHFSAYILDDSSQVNSVHLGICIEMIINDGSKVSVKETDKLAGRWVTEDELFTLYQEDKLESWSKMYVDAGLVCRNRNKAGAK